MIERLRSVRIPVSGKSVAVFDLVATAALGYTASRLLRIPLPIGILGAFAIGHATHKVLRVSTAFS